MIRIMVTHDSGARLTIDFIPSATLEPVITIAETDTLARARTLMEVNDFSQLPVVKGKGNRAVGVVSWQSIGKALLSNPDAELAECIDRSVRKVAVDSDLVSAIGTVNTDGYVLVTRDHGAISGIVTSADLGDALAGIAGPYLSISGCENAMRQLVLGCLAEGALDAGDVTSAVLDVNKTFDGDVNDLTFGDLVNVLALTKAWAAIGKGYDKGVLVDQLNRVCALRNKIMHFRKQDEKDEVTAVLLPSVVRVLERLVIANTRAPN